MLSIRLPPNSELVTDPDEEVFVIYSLLQSKPRSEHDDFRGLGYVDSRKDVLDINFDITLPSNDSPDRSKTRSGRRKIQVNESKTITVTLAQDKTALRSRKGDTGSILWKASIDFAKLILQQIHSTPNDSILDPQKLREQHILELGSGTGLLSVIFAPLVGQFTATDIGDLVPLIRKNLTLNFPGWSANAQGANVSAEELDWVVLSTANASQRKRIADFKPADILLVVDCIYHPSLLPHLVETIDYLSVPEKTAVFILVELRAEDVIRDFLTLWLNKPLWQIWRIGEDVFPMPYVAWVGCKTLS
ncbi:putative methyltransferase-domain-containing protein [Amanita rubescens]|nr:putative methyltransferase-domain-containing protein [Amanita rubescens]